MVYPSSSAKVCPCDFLLGGDFHGKYVLGRQLGLGAFAHVYAITGTSENDATSHSIEKAVKILDLRPKGEKDILRKLQVNANQEASVWASAGQHCHVVQMLATFYDIDLCYMVMEKCACGLYDYLDQALVIDERVLGGLIAQMLAGLSHIHFVRIVHRDVKPDNFLLGGKDGQTVKLGDFGLSTELSTAGGATGVFGTAPFMCPEMLLSCEYDGRADIWSMGVLAYTLLYGDFPYLPKVPSARNMKEAILDGVHPKYEPSGDFRSQWRSNIAINFVQTLLDRDPDTRPSATEALHTKYIVECVAEHHMPKCDLPSLRPMIHLAKRAGAFEARDVKKEKRMDSLLRTKQMEKHSQAPSIETSLAKTVSRTGKKLKASFAASAILNIWDDACSAKASASSAKSNASRAKSFTWGDSSSDKSSAWSNASSPKLNNWSYTSSQSTALSCTSSTWSITWAPRKANASRGKFCSTDALFPVIVPAA
mmetsp:Transcript_89366/g.141090  ORF Transcript_89366/g.141090 Transcript_89366/m.141090 type:complete len:480 (-) Transcript_89366:160-1599(-)|eukprot:CAMPEP_0169110418 /NCGR_PEP_ID=MMETSP1015-20121227/26501_1 /TAXON_ID=342587 /ORGANISM="Karlodinium micrum, Strain CCMP2283" /LENGTH=479 /DNA_ID=CAMNT_0009172207 /DNA_START=63 /DNA_END=1502 /DNA_ORIENTATION=+